MSAVGLIVFKKISVLMLCMTSVGSDVLEAVQKSPVFGHRSLPLIRAAISFSRWAHLKTRKLPIRGVERM